LTLTVSDVRRSTEFYTGIMGFRLLLEFGPRALLSNGSVVLSLTPPYDPARAVENDIFNENRIGLDPVSLSMPDLNALEAAATFLDDQGVTRGEIRDLGPGLGIFVMAVRDPDNIQLELTAARDA
jgi:glyoxylase I family protein